jgi:hypothetical protein
VLISVIDTAFLDVVRASLTVAAVGRTPIFASKFDFFGEYPKKSDNTHERALAKMKDFPGHKA